VVILPFHVLLYLCVCCADTDTAERQEDFRLILTPVVDVGNLARGLDTFTLSCIRNDLASPLTDPDSDTRRCKTVCVCVCVCVCVWSVLLCAHAFCLILVIVAYPSSRVNLDTSMHAQAPFEACPATTSHTRVCSQKHTTSCKYPACNMYVWEY
jgi:hypothetical protein